MKYPEKDAAEAASFLFCHPERKRRIPQPLQHLRGFFDSGFASAQNDTPQADDHIRPYTP